jgi:osmoprotectant transport system permease protein
MKPVLNGFPWITDNLSLVFDKTGVHLVFAVLALFVSIVIALPVGVWLGHVHRGGFAAINVSNVGRALPSLAVIAILIGVIGLGRNTLIVALVVLAVPVILTNAYVAIDNVDRDIVDAARGMGLRELQILTRVELPLSLPLLFAGIRTAAVFIVATVPLGALTGTDGGLGDIIANQASYRLEGVVGAAICVAVLALLVDGLFAAIQRAVTPRGLRGQIDFAAVQSGSRPPDGCTARRRTGDRVRRLRQQQRQQHVELGSRLDRDVVDR